MTATDKKTDNPEDNPQLQKWKAKRAYLDDIPLRDTLTILEANGNQDNDRNKWKIEGVGNIIVKGQRWLNGNLSLAGFGSVSLVRHALDLEKDTEAMQKLSELFPEYAADFVFDGSFVEKSFEDTQEPEKGFTPPEPFTDGNQDVHDYLVGQRQIPSALVEREIKSGKIYATRKWDHDNRRYGESQCVFIGQSSAELRSTIPQGFKGCCVGSDSDKSGYQVMFQEPFAGVVALTEAAVDALSYHALHPHHFVVSTNGAGRFAYQYSLTLEVWRNGQQTKWALDADGAGDIAAQRLFNALYLRDNLSEKWGVTPEEVDQWLLSGKIISAPNPSPHEMFLDIERSADEQYDVYEGVRKEFVSPETKRKKIEVVWEDTGKKKPATVIVKLVKGNVGELKRGTVEEFQISSEDIQATMDKYHSERLRPQKAKDWNEVWSRKGLKAMHDYDSLFDGSKKLPAPEGGSVKAEAKAKAKAKENSKDEGKALETPVQEPAVAPPKNRFQRTSAF